MNLDATLAALHYICIIMLVVFLSSEAVLCKPEYMSATTIRRLGKYDLLYFGFAMAALATGLARVYWGVKGAAFYSGNVFFWAKVTTFALIGLLSLPPTLAFMRWRKQFKACASAQPSADEVMTVRRWILWEAHVLILLPVFAALMARGFGR